MSLASPLTLRLLASSRHPVKRRPGRRRFAVRLRLDPLEDRTLPSAAFWSGFGGNAQHTADSPVQSQSLDAIHWQSPVDLNPQFSGNDLLIHYGEPAITLKNTVIVPVKTGATDGFRIEARDGSTGQLRWTESTDYTLAGMTFNWTPSYGPVLTPQGRVYFAGAGGTVYYIDNPDSATAPVEHQLAFYGLANYAANPAAFKSSVFIDTPITSDANGNIFFGFRVEGTAPAPLSTTESGWARIGADGSGRFVLVDAMTGDPNITRDSHNVAPAVSNDGQTVYVVAKGPTAFYAYLVGLDSTTLATKYQVFLNDPRQGNNPAGESDNGTASPLVGPDGDVYLGVLPKIFNGSRGFMLHFNSSLTTEFAPGAFGWDDTASIVPASMVPSYTGPSSYLLFTKYNNYAARPDFPEGGDGFNQIAVLDPHATELDPNNDGAPTMPVMKEVLTIAGPTPDPAFIDRFPNARKEWCINSAVVDPASKSVFANSEDGKLYRWDLTTNSFTQVVTLTPGIGEAYTPTWMGPDGTVYAINNATLFAVGQSKLMGPSVPAVQSPGGLEPSFVASTVSSSNWSGYAAETNFSTPQSGAVSAVSGSWTVPTVLNTKGTAYAAFWVGIDGYSSNSVEQIGTDSDIVNGVPTYYAWYEMYPNPVHRIGAVSPGDVITASVTADASNNFTLTIADASSTSWTNPFTITLAAAGAQRSSAEWIAEAPLGSFGRVLPLANFGMVSFTNARATINGVTGPIDGSSWQNNSIIMSSNSTGVKATPSGLTDTTTAPVTSSFSVTWSGSGSGGGGGGHHGPNVGGLSDAIRVENDPNGPAASSFLSWVEVAAPAGQVLGWDPTAYAPPPVGNRFDPGARLPTPVSATLNAAVTNVLFARGFEDAAPLDRVDRDAVLGPLAAPHWGGDGDLAAF